MNFRFTLAKTIISLIIGFLFGYFYKSSIFGGVSFIEWGAIGLTFTCILYIIWSLFQKK